MVAVLSHDVFYELTPRERSILSPSMLFEIFDGCRCCGEGSWSTMQLRPVLRDAKKSFSELLADRNQVPGLGLG
jgi:hypothetical protein